MSGPDGAPVTLSARPGARLSPSRLTVRIVAFVALGAGLGALAGFAWAQVVDLPAYRVNPDGGANTSERGLAGYFGGDAWFTVLGLVVGLVLGFTAWRRLGRWGWPVAVLAAAVALTSSLLCWTVGYHLGPGDFNSRLAQARPGDLVPIALTIRARASLVVWPLFAVIPVLLGASLGRDPDEPPAA